VRYFDSHCHVTDDATLAAARAASVHGMVVVGCDRASSEGAIAVAAAHTDVWATVGLHPHEARHGVDTVADLIARPRVVAVGEAGLDYYYDHSPRDAQRDAFAAQIQLAHHHDLPLVIHTRDAWDDTFDVLAGEGPPAGTIFHCFTGGPDEARRCLELGAHVSFSGIVTFKRATDVQAAARLVPIDRLLLETDAPYLAPVPHRGTPNQPAYVAHTAQFVADLRDVPVAEIAAATDRNARAVFRLPA
jgi:TatD DNase family protein